MSDEQGEYWDGALWIYHATITNDGSNSGIHEYDLVPGVGNELEVLYGRLNNGDASNRVVHGYVKDADGGNILASVIGDDSGTNLNAARALSFPFAQAEDSSNGQAFAAGVRFFLAGAMSLNLTLAAIAVSQDTSLGLVCRIRGGVPTVILTSPTDAVEVVNTNQVV